MNRRVLSVADVHYAPELIADFKHRVEQELETICREVLVLVEQKLLKTLSLPADSAVFYLKMLGDYYRYLAEITAAEAGHGRRAATFYGQAMAIAQDKFSPTDPVRLGLALNYSVCFYEIIKDKKQACALAKSAFDQAITKLDQLNEEAYRDSTLIMQLLRDNLTLWTTDGHAGVPPDDDDE